MSDWVDRVLREVAGDVRAGVPQYRLGYLDGLKAAVVLLSDEPDWRDAMQHLRASVDAVKEHLA